MVSLAAMRRLAYLATAFGMLAAGCVQPARIPPPPIDPAAYSSDTSQSLVRLAPSIRESRRTATLEPILAHGGQFNAQQLTGDQGEVRTCLTGSTGLNNAHKYTESRIRLVTPIAGQFAFVWQNAIEPDITLNPGLPFTVVSDGRVHEYTIALEGQDAAGWVGPITAMGVIGPGNEFTVESIALTDSATDEPNRITLGNVTMEAVGPSPTNWKVNVAPDAEFETHVALLDPPNPTMQMDGAHFRVRVREGASDPVTLVEAAIGLKDRGKWLALRSSLEPFAGKSVEFLFEIDPLDSARGDYAVWGNPTVVHRATQPHMPIILISCDTMRADHLSCYGYPRETSPNLDAFAKEAVLFENAITPETWTLTAHTSMLTGLYPTHHGVNASTNLAESVQTLPETLSGAGYRTGGFTGYRMWMTPWSGLAHGFDMYSTPALVRDMPTTRNLVDAWLDTCVGAPFFLFFHNYDLHSKYGTAQCEECDLPYYPPPNTPLYFAKDMPEPKLLRERSRPSPTEFLIAACGNADAFSPEELEYMIALYDDSIRGVDAGLSDFFAKLKAMKLYDNALIVVTSDHGEHFGEHSQYVHEHVYEGTVKVPLLIKFPYGEHGGKRVRDMVQLVDVMPTILEAAGVAAPTIDGRNLLPVINGTSNSAPWAYTRRQKLVAVRNNDWKYIRSVETGVAELYHLALDPRETVNVLEQSPPELAVLEDLLNRFYFENQQGWHIAFLRPDRKWRGKLVATTGGTFQTAKLLVGGSVSYVDLIKWDEHTATVNLGFLPQEELLLRTTGTNASVSLQISAPKPFVVQLGNAEPAKGRTYSVELDPALPLPKPALPRKVNKPTLLIWHEEEPVTGTQAPALTPEEMAVLSALGYGGDIQKALEKGVGGH